MAIHNRAGQPAQQSDLINVAQLTAQYYVLKPEAGNAACKQQKAVGQTRAEFIGQHPDNDTGRNS